MDIFELASQGKITRIFLTRNKVIPEGSIAHIVQRAPGRERLYLEDNDYIYFIHLLKEISKKYNFKIFCFSLMPNHFHLLTNFQENNASSAIKNLCERYAMYFNKKYERKGHVFYGRFRVSLCFDEAYLLAASLYIHLNPSKAGLCKQPDSYRWSSALLYIKKFESKTFVDYKFILKIIDDNITQAKEIYRRLLKDCQKKEMESILENKKALSLFREKIWKLISGIFQEDKNKKYILSEIELENKIKELQNKKRLRKPQDIQARKYIVEQLLSRGYGIKEIGMRLGITRQCVHKILTSPK